MMHARTLLACVLATGCATPTQGNGQRVAQASDACGTAGSDDNAGVRTLVQDDLQSVALVNEVSSCIALTAQKLVGLGSVAIGIYGLTHVKPLGECGCMSSTLGYRVLQKQEEPSGELPPDVPALEPIQRVFGSVDVSRETRNLSLVVSPDHELYAGASLTLVVACLGPE